MQTQTQKQAQNPSRPLRLLTVIIALNKIKYNTETLIAIATQCEFIKLPGWLKKRWLRSKNLYKRLAVLHNLKDAAPPELIEWALDSKDPVIIRSVLEMFKRNPPDLPFELIERFERAVESDYDARLFFELCRHQVFSWQKVETWTSSNWNDQRAAALLMVTPEELPLKVLKKCLGSNIRIVREAAIEVARKKPLSMKNIKKWYGEYLHPETLSLSEISSSEYFVESLFRACTGRTKAKEFLIDILLGKEAPPAFVWQAVIAAADAFRGISLSSSEQLQLLDLATKSKDASFREGLLTVLFNAFPTSPVVEEVKTVLLDHAYEKPQGVYVREAFAAYEAARYAVYHGTRLMKISGWSPIREVNPGTFVYKKCIAGVIVVAEIPLEATTRGPSRGKCRSDKAIVRDIHGSLFGEKVGLSRWDPSVSYRIGDVIEIDDFDTTSEDCSVGFHFFLSEEEARFYPF